MKYWIRGSLNESDLIGLVGTWRCLAVPSPGKDRTYASVALSVCFAQWLAMIGDIGIQMSRLVATVPLGKSR